MLGKTRGLVGIVFLVSALSVGCAGLQVKRGVDGNTLYSSSRPRLTVEVGPGYRLIKEQKNANSQFFANSDGSSNIEQEIFRFWNDEKMREVQVQFHRTQRQNVYWNPFDFKDAKNLIEAGEETLNGDVYHYGVYPVVNPGGCFLVKAVGRRIGAQSDTKMLLYFAERVGSKDALAKWKNKEVLGAEQKRQLRTFLEAFQTDVKIMDYVERGAG
jgi:hypothetical protein